MIIDTRDPSFEKATAAHEFAEWFDLKHAILLGFRADAGADGMKLIRAWGPENADLASYTEPAWQLVQTVTILLKQKGVLESSSFGQYVVDQLKRGDIVWCFKDSSQRTLCSQDVTHEILDEALDVKGHWVAMLTDAVRAECPSWERLQAFQCLSSYSSGKEIETADA